MTLLRPTAQLLARPALRACTGSGAAAPESLLISNPIRARPFSQLSRAARPSLLNEGSASSSSPSFSLTPQTIRTIRTPPRQAANGHSQSTSSNLAKSFALTAPHGAPAADAPTSFSQPGGWMRALTSLGIIGGTAFAANMFFNRETRDSLDPMERSYLNKTYTYLGTGLALTAGMAVALHRSGLSVRVMTANPWLVLGVGLVGSIGGMIGTLNIAPENTAAKWGSWLLFNGAQAAVLSPLLFLNPAILARAGLYTAGIVGSLCYVGATAKDGQFLFLGGPLLAGVTLVALSSLAPLLLPRTAFRALALTESLSLYGGLAVFTGFVLYDTQKVLLHAKLVREGKMREDTMAESVGLELDFINIFVRVVQILGMQQAGSRRK